MKGEKGLRGDDTFGSLGLVGFPGLPGLRGLKGEIGDVGEAGIMKRKYKNIRFSFNSKRFSLKGDPSFVCPTFDGSCTIYGEKGAKGNINYIFMFNFIK